MTGVFVAALFGGAKVSGVTVERVFITGRSHSTPARTTRQIDYPTLQVSVSLPGASPETMAATVATPL